MAKKLQSGLVLKGISPNILISHVENTAPFLFKGELITSTQNTKYLDNLIFFRKNLHLLKNLNLLEYFNLCMAAHWATAGTFVPTDVDNQIREGLWKHEVTGKFIKKMAETTIDSWRWNYSQVTNRKLIINSEQSLSTHEGTWLSVAIGSYCALEKNKITEQKKDIEDVILAEIKKEQDLLNNLRENRDHLNFLKATALMAHNLGDLDRVFDIWEVDDDHPFKKRIYKLGHNLNSNYSTILAYAGNVNKEFMAIENHRHMAMRQAKCLRKSHQFLIPVGPFMDDWGKTLGESKLLSSTELAEIIFNLFDGYNRQNKASGYIRAFAGILSTKQNGFLELEEYLPFNIIEDIKKSDFFKKSLISKDEHEANHRDLLDKFRCPLTNQKF